MSDQTLYVTVNQNSSRYFLLRFLPCAGCDYSIPANREDSSVHVKPVTYASQQGRCPRCGASNLVLSARTEAECTQLERLAAGFDGIVSINKKSLAVAE